MNSVDPRDPARNLVFGLLAFQLNFIDRRALLAAFDAWTADKSRSLGRVLVEQGAISDDLLALIDGLVAAHLARHDNEPEKSLAALSPIGSVIKDLEALADPEARASLSQLSLAPSNYDPFATNFESVGDTTSSGTRFRILRPLNKGGMGVVSVALDTELDRSIALKEIRDTAANDQAYRARFLAEAEITGKLEHPGIIPIYGLGTYADGRPFYAMRLIRGDKTGSLMDAIERFHKEPNPSARVVDFRGLLGRFLDVCNALSYAHSKGVLHRDLKPDNILLGPYGETLVVDWGLAKAAGKADPVASVDGDQVRLNLSGSELSPTLAGGAMGTPEYAPPEQMIGDLPNIGPRSDVYGLGAVLYCLMTGQAPFSRKGTDLGKLIQKIEAADFPPPRQVRAQLDKPLEAICLKAMARKPEARYESVRALAADVECYLADEPVSAYREPWTVRARRWTKKHRTAVASAAATLVVALAALTVGLIVVGGLNRRLDRANTDLLTSNKKLDKANTDLAEALGAATNARNLAEDRKKVADANFTLALEAVKSQVFDINRQLRYRSGTRDLRETLQKSATERLKSLVERASQRDEADRTTMMAFMNLGEVYYLVDLKPSLARAEYEKAHALATKLAEGSPENKKAQRDLAISYDGLGEITLMLGQAAEALALYRKGLAIRQDLAKADPADTEAQRDLSISCNKTGEALLRLGQVARARELYQRGLTVREALARSAPANAEAQRDLSVSYTKLGDVMLRLGQSAESMAFHEKAVAISEALARADPTSTRAQRDLATSYNSLGAITLRLGQVDKALASYQKGLAVSEALAKADPVNALVQRDLSISHDGLGNVALKLGRSDEALASYQKGLAVSEALAKADPADARAQRDLSVGYSNLGDISRQLGHRSKALSYYDKALAVREALAKADPADAEFQYDLAYSHDRVGNVNLELGKADEALGHYDKAQAIREARVKADPDDAEARLQLSVSFHKQGSVALQLGRPAKALESFTLALGLFQARANANPANEQAQRELKTVRLDHRLAALINGDREPEDNAERLELARRAYDKALHATAARLWIEAIETDPKLAEDRQAENAYNAACAAALAGSGHGKDVPKPDEAAKAKLRGQAQTWLKSELSAWKRVVMTVGPGNKELVAKTLAHWKGDADLAGVRDASALDKLPEAERKGWQALWGEVDSLLGKVKPK
jgi:eukaryotic-like serine/threonine-protein kinase